MNGYSRIHRLLKIITLIHARRGWKAITLAQECGVSERTIFDDIKQLRAAGVPIDLDEENGYLIRKDFFLPPVDLTLEEAIALLLLAKHLGDAGEISFAEPAGKAARKLLAILPANVRNDTNELLEHSLIKLARTQNDSSGDVYKKVQTAILNKRALLCTYESARQKAKTDSDDAPFRFDPFALYFGQRAWYVIGKHHGRADTRCLKLSRFLSCKITDTPFAIPDTFSVANHFGLAWRMMPSGTVYDIELHFDPTVAETVADIHWHDTQEIYWNDDGSIRMTLRVDGLEEIVWWILSYGAHCKVIQPPALSTKVATLIHAAAKQYPHT